MERRAAPPLGQALPNGRAGMSGIRPVAVRPRYPIRCYIQASLHVLSERTENGSAVAGEPGDGHHPAAAAGGKEDACQLTPSRSSGRLTS